MRNLLLTFVVASGALLASCGSRSSTCQPSNCAGCCDSTGTCVVGNVPSECGIGGVTCGLCTSTQQCTAGVCVGGTGGGTAGGSGGGTAGGSGGGTAGGSGGGTAGGTGGGTAGGTAGGSGGGTAGGTGGGTAGGTASCGNGAAAGHLLISEVRVTPSPAEFIEIHNPTAASIDLTDYRLYNATYVSTDGGMNCYAYLPTQGTCGQLQGTGDFNLQFPAGATIAAGQFKVIALNGAYNYCGDGGPCVSGLPDFEIPAAAGGHPNVPDMLGVWDTSSAGSSFGFLTNASEDLTLYKWDGNSSNLIKDVDYFIWGSNASIRTDKTGISSYLPDTATASQHPITTSTSVTTDYQRVCFNENSETQSGGNGLTGHDETSENLANTWTVGTPTPGTKTVGGTP